MTNGDPKTASKDESSFTLKLDKYENNVFFFLLNVFSGV